MLSLLRKSSLTVSETFFRSVEGLVEDTYLGLPMGRITLQIGYI